MGISYPISVTFVEVQLGSGGVLCVAQGTAQSHGKEGEDQWVPTHQLHLELVHKTYKNTAVIPLATELRIAKLRILP